MRTTIVGSYPKVTETGSDNLPGTIDRWQRHAVNDSALQQEIEKVIHRVVQEQEQAGLDLITDGQIQWEDLPHPVARSASGIQRGALRRFFNNNVYYRRLQLNGVQWKKSFLAEEFQSVSRYATKPVKVSLPGPLTLVYSTEPKENQTPEKLLSLYEDLLRKEVEALEKVHVREIQIEEPAFRPAEPLLKQGLEAIGRIFKGIKARRWIAFYFHDLSSLLPMVGQLPVEVLSLDLATAPQLVDRLKDLNWKGELALGLVDGRNTKLESIETLKKQLQAISKVVPSDRLWLSANCGLEFLPHEVAFKKLQLLKDAARGV